MTADLEARALVAERCCAELRHRLRALRVGVRAHLEARRSSNPDAEQRTLQALLLLLAEEEVSGG